MAFTVSPSDRYFIDEYVPLSFLLKEAFFGLYMLCIKALNAFEVYLLRVRLNKSDTSD